MSGRFLERWSRLKRQGAIGAAPVTPGADAAAAAPPVALAQPLPPPAAVAAAADGEVASALPPIASLTLESDFSAFLKREVADAVRKQALKKLFAEPHFNVMDGLDIYIDDYSISAPIPPDVLARLKHARELLASDEAVAGPSAQGVEAAAPAAAAEGAAQEPKPAGEDTLPATQGAVADGDDPQAQGVIQGNLSEGGQKV